MQVREKVGKLRNTAFLQWFVALEGRKVGSLKRRVRSQLARWEMKNCTPLWREAHFQVKMRKTHQRRILQKLWCHKSVRRCGAKHIWKSKVWKTDGFRALLEVEMSQKCTPLWREAHFQVKMRKTHQRRITFKSCDVTKVYAVVARSTCPSQNVKKHHMLGPLLKVQIWFRVAGAKDFAPYQKWTTCDGFVIFPKKWQAWSICRGPAKMYFAWQARYKRHVHHKS